MNINRQEFINALKSTKHAVASKTIIPIFTYIKLDGDSIYSFNGELGIKSKLDTGVTCLFPGETLLKLLDASSCNDVFIETTQNKNTVKIGDSVTTFATPNCNDFIFKEPTLPEKKVTITQEFILGITKCLPSISTNPLQEEKNGITLTSEGLFSTDSVRISRFLFTEKLPIEDKILLPEAFCKVLCQINLSFPATLYIGSDFILVTSETISIYSKILTDITFVNFEKVIKQIYSPTLPLFVIPQSFRESINKCLILSQKDGTVFIEGVDRSILINLIQEGKGNFYKDTIPVDGELTVVQHKYLLEYFHHGINNTTFFIFNKGKNDVIFIGREGNFLYLLSSYPIK